MNYQSLLYFKTVAELQHYTRAANELFITQPALSKAIKNLEVELGCNLFQKDGRNVSLTRYGTCFYEYVKRALGEIDEGVSAVRHMVDVENNTVFISALYNMYFKFLPDKVLRFRRLHPSRFVIRHKYTTAILQDVLDRHSELGLCSDFSPEGVYSPLSRYPLYQEPLVLIVGKEHRFAGRDSVKVEELKGEPFIVWFWSTLGSNKVLTDLCAEAGFEPNILTEAYNDYGVMGMVAAGDGIAFCPLVDCERNPSVVKIPIDLDRPLVRTINLIWRTDVALSPLTTAFRDMLIADSKQYGSEDSLPEY